jgi:hypothetical protein
MQSLSACKYCNVREYGAVIQTELPYVLRLLEYKFVGYGYWYEQQLKMCGIPGNISTT